MYRNRLDSTSITSGFRLQWPSGPNRKARRYPLSLDVNYRVQFMRQTVTTGVGKLVDISSKGLMLATTSEAEPGHRVDLSIDWPTSARVKLTIAGEVLRVDEKGMAVRILRYAFEREAEEPAASQATNP